MILTRQGRNVKQTDVTLTRFFKMEFSVAVMRNSGGLPKIVRRYLNVQGHYSDSCREIYVQFGAHKRMSSLDTQIFCQFRKSLNLIISLVNRAIKIQFHKRQGIS
jgi:hypothetical protein